MVFLSSYFAACNPVYTILVLLFNKVRLVFGWLVESALAVIVLCFKRPLSLANQIYVSVFSI